MSQDFIATIGNLSLASRLKRLSDHLMQSVAAIYRERGLDFEPRWFPAFRFLLEREEAAVGEIAQALGVSHAAVSQVTQAMKRAGLVESRKDASDERRTVLTLTERGRQLRDELAPVWQDIRTAMDETLGERTAILHEQLAWLEAQFHSRDLPQRVRDARRRRLQASVRIVPFEPRLAPWFKSLNLAWIERFFTVEAPDREILDDPVGHVIAAGGQILFALVGDDVVGTCALVKDGDRLELAKMAVSDHYQGYGIGDRLMQAALEAAREAGARSVYLLTSSKLQPAIALYRKYGFQVTHAGPHPSYARTDLIMELPLAGVPA